MDGFKAFIGLGGVAFIFLLGMSMFACERIDVGNVGLKINVASADLDSRGVQKTPTVTGYVWYNPFTEVIVEFPTTTQTVVWQEAEAIQFASNKGITATADVAFGYHVDPTKASVLYQRYKVRDLEVFAHGFLHNQVRDALNEVGSHMIIDDIYGEKKGELLVNARKFMKPLEEFGVVVDQLTFNGPVRIPQNIQAAINASIEATQRAQVAENELRMIKANAAKAVAEAEGTAQSKVASAQGEAAATKARSEAEAAAILVKAEAQAKANALIRQELSPQFIQLQMVQKWNGVLPVIGETGGQMFLDARNILDSKK